MDFSGLPEGSLKVMDNKAKFDEVERALPGHAGRSSPDIEPELKAKLQKMALDAYRALRVRDYGRIDLRLTESGEIYVIEVNANCYLEKQGEFVMAAEAHGIELQRVDRPDRRPGDRALEARGTVAKKRRTPGGSRGPRPKPSDALSAAAGPSAVPQTAAGEEPRAGCASGK